MKIEKRVFVEYHIWPGGSLVKPYDGTNPIVCGDFCVTNWLYPGDKENDL